MLSCAKLHYGSWHDGQFVGDHGGVVEDVYKCNEAALDARAEETFQWVEDTMAASMSVSSEKKATLNAPLLPRNCNPNRLLVQ